MSNEVVKTKGRGRPPGAKNKSKKPAVLVGDRKIAIDNTELFPDDVPASPVVAAVASAAESPAIVAVPSVAAVVAAAVVPAVVPVPESAVALASEYFGWLQGSY
jgi:hypothetical protein